jgi:hypothetical protein
MTTRKGMLFVVDMGDRDDAEAAELLDNIEEYIRLKGWTKKRFLLEGAGMIIAQENPALAMQIFDFIVNNIRSKRARFSREYNKR